MYKHKHLDIDFFDEQDAIDIIIFFKSGDNAHITDIIPSVSTDEQYLSVQQTGRYGKSFYFDVDTVRYFAISPRENGNAWRFTKPIDIETGIDQAFNLED